MIHKVEQISADTPRRCLLVLITAAYLIWFLAVMLVELLIKLALVVFSQTLAYLTEAKTAVTQFMHVVKNIW